MENYQKELTLIKTILKNNTKGMTVTDIAREINVNRNSVAKYLDILLISGHVEMITFGPAKVFFPSRRVPLSTVLNFISDYILVIDNDLKIILINDTLLEFLDHKRETLLSQRIDQTNIPLFTTEIIQHITSALEGKEYAEEICLQSDDDEFYFSIRLLPTAFEDGGLGVTIILTNITEKRRIENALKGNKTKQNTVITSKKEDVHSTKKLD